MNEYHKIQTVYKRDPDTNYRTLVDECYAKPEFSYLKDCKWQFTEKVDGTNIRVIASEYDDGAQTLEFKGKTDRAQIPPFLMEWLTNKFDANDFTGFDKGVTLYGEGYGAKIQKGGGLYMPDGVAFVLFDVKIGHTWLQRGDVMDIANQFEIGYVPTIGFGTLDDMVNTVKSQDHLRI